ncbi:MAG: hypothetical protein KJZ78_24825 [Bryobacteraceae bacterium]|nr:hypothetical protein [Bryobacteraceae bacterium]
MLDFRRRSRSVNYLQGKQQYKLFGLMICAVLMMLLVSLAADPGRWDWVFAGQKPEAERGKEIFTPDTRLAARQADDELGTFISAPEGIAAEGADKPEAFFPGVRTDYLRTVRDDTIFRKAEGDAWFHLFRLLSKADPKALAKASTGTVSFRQLYQQPRGVSKKAAPKNSYGIDHYYQLAIEPDGERGQLVVAYCLDLPAGFPVGDKVFERATLNGFFFKRWAYAAQDAVRTAPLVLAKTVDWKPVPPPEKHELEFHPLTVVAIAFGMFLVVAVGYALMRPWRTSPKTAETSTTQFSPDALATRAAADEGASRFRPADEPEST